jgi:hypothetical protein
VRRTLIHTRLTFAILVACAASVACEPRAQPVEQPEPPIPVAERDERVRRPILIEGMADTLEFRLVRAPRDFWSPFSTYAPVDMAVDFTSVDELRVVHFTAEFGGVRNERARLSFYIHPPGSTVEQAQAQLAAYLSGLFPDDTPIARDEPYEQADPVEPASHYPWAQHESRYTVPHPDGRGMLVGRSGVGVHGDRVFHFVIEYPAEYGDGMGPRVEAILDEWRWEPDGTMLRDARAAG